MNELSGKGGWFWDSQIRVLRFALPGGDKDGAFMLVTEEEAWQKKNELERRNHQTQGDLRIKIIKIEEIPENAMLQQHFILRKNDYPVLVNVAELLRDPPSLKLNLERFIFCKESDRAGLEWIFKKNDLNISTMRIQDVLDPKMIFVRQSIKLGGIWYSFFTKIASFKTVKKLPAERAN